MSDTVLIVGSGGREHAIGWRLSRDPSPPACFFAPGNAGTARLGENIPLRAEDMDALVAWAETHRPDLVVIGPEVPLCAGLADAMQSRGVMVFGPTRDAARMEGSKAFAKDVMRAAGVPTAHAFACRSPRDAYHAIDSLSPPMVLKADGLAAGKGVLICASRAEARLALDALMIDRQFGDAGETVLVEAYLEGEEASILALVDGQTVIMLPAAQDHKRAFDGDLGPNTGGMGAYSPPPIITPVLRRQLLKTVFNPTLAELNRRGIRYRGVLYAGLMFTREGPRVLEFNCRFGDPETQVILPRIQSDFYPLLRHCAAGTLSQIAAPEFSPLACVSVVMASRGYPGAYSTHCPIKGLDGELPDQVQVFHAGTTLLDGRVVTAGGRVLNVTATALSLEAAVERAYAAVAGIHFDGAFWRRDIAHHALKRRDT